MQAYALKRLLLTVPILFLVLLFSFLIIHLIPGDVLVARLGERGFSSPEQVQRQRHQLHLDESLPAQFGDWLGGAVRGDFGSSLITGQPVRDRIAKALPPTIELGVLAMLIGLVVAFPLGLVSALWRNSWVDYLARFVAIAGISLPSFWMGLILIIVLTRQFGWFPKIGFASLLRHPITNLQQLIFPAIILGFGLSAATARILRSTMLDVISTDYVRTAWAKGLRQYVVTFRHALPNALIPVVTVFGAQLSLLVGGAVLLEVLFVIPGMGQLTLAAVQQRDYTQVQANVLVLGAFIVVVNLLVDLSYSLLDPRIRQG